jgi:hypothetical protein
MSSARRTLPPFDRILARLAKEYPEPLSWDGCWPWPGSIGSHGYGQISVNGGPELIHRVIYDAVYGLIPEGHVVDHQCHNNDLSCAGGKTCRHRRCCNWFHYTTKTYGQNSSDADQPRQRGKFKTHCSKNHPYDDANTMWITRIRNGKEYRTRQCRACNRENVYRIKHGSERPADATESLSRAGTPVCRRGHAYDEQNTKYDTTTGKRRCRRCERFNDLRSKWQKKNNRVLTLVSVEEMADWEQHGMKLKDIYWLWERGNFGMSKEDRMAEVARNGGITPDQAPEAYQRPDGSVNLPDGLHRWWTCRKQGITEIPVDLRPHTEAGFAF